MAGFDGPVAVGRVDIGMAYSTGLDLDDDFTRSRCWFRDVFDYERFVERVNDGCFHLLSPRLVHACDSTTRGRYSLGSHDLARTLRSSSVVVSPVILRRLSIGLPVSHRLQRRTYPDF